MSARNIFLGILILIIASSVAYLQSTGKYGLTLSLAILSLFVLGFINAILSNQSDFRKGNNIGFAFTTFISFCFLGIAYFICHQVSISSIFTAAVYTSCFFLPTIVLKNWQLYRMALQPAAIGFWSLPVPYVKSNAISLHLNSIPFTIKVASIADSNEQEYSVTAPGVKTLGTVFSELIYEEQSSTKSADFSDITNNQYNWVFYVRELGGLRNRQLDANLSLLDNHVKTNATITAQRQ